MIILNTNSELKTTFERLLKTIKEPIEWNGRFVVIGDYLILQGRVRSLFFNFESRKLLSNLIDIPVQEEEIVEISTYTKVQNVLNLTLYAFGKWGLIRSVKVEQDYAQLNTLFTGVLREFSVEPGYSREKFRFYKDGVRINYEDVISLALESNEETIEEVKKEGDSAGLWHKLVWKKQKASFQKTETTFEQRQKNRLGNNFYMVSYQCPKCKDHLHMVVFPEGKEFRIETEEGGVFLARAYICEACHSFYTPRPELLLAEGDVYYMDFFKDSHAYDDYKELLGANGARVSNYKFNEFEAVRKRKEKLQMEEEGDSLEELCRDMDALPDRKLLEIAEKMEEGFYPLGSIEKFEETIQKEALKRKKKNSAVKQDLSEENRKRPQADGVEAAAAPKQKVSGAEDDSKASGAKLHKAASGAKPHQGESGAEPHHETDEAGVKNNPQEIPALRLESAKKRYAAKCSVLDRMSPMQVQELKNELLRDKNLYDTDKEPFFKAIQKKEKQQKLERIQSLAAGAQGGNYAKIKRIVEEIEKIDLPNQEKTSILDKLYAEKKRQGEAEAAELLKKMPEKPDMKQFQTYMKRLEEYPEVDFTPYEEFLNEKKKQAQNREISNMIRHAQAKDRTRLVELMDRLKNQPFDADILEPYMKELEEKLRIADENAIAEICGNPTQMSAEETMEAYKKIEEGVFLPELKTNALEMLKKRLAKLKTDECELLVHRFRDGLVGRIQENDRHHFYPARKVMAKEAEPEEYRVIQYALDTYGTKRGMFEYPIFVVDTSRDRSGKEGMILTPDHLFYHSMLNAYAVSIGDIKSMHSQTGFLHTGLFLEMRDGTRVKIPYAVEKKELTAWGNCLEEFIHYLQEKPDSRKVTYLAKEKHDLICCFRCGYSYKGGNVCPKCGYKMNR